METATLALRAGLSLVCVLGLVWFLAKLAAKHPLGRRSTGGHTEVVARQQLSRAASVAVVRVGDRTLVLGVTDQQVTLLHTDINTDTGAAGPAATEPAPVDLVATDDLLDPASLPVPVQGPGPRRTDALSGSALSPATWGTAVQVLREKTVRR